VVEVVVEVVVEADVFALGSDVVVVATVLGLVVGVLGARVAVLFFTDVAATPVRATVAGVVAGDVGADEAVTVAAWAARRRRCWSRCQTRNRPPPNRRKNHTAQ